MLEVGLMVLLDNVGVVLEFVGVVLELVVVVVVLVVVVVGVVTVGVVGVVTVGLGTCGQDSVMLWTGWVMLSDESGAPCGSWK